MYLITAFVIIVAYTLAFRVFKGWGDTRSLLDEEIGTRQLYHHIHSATRFKR